MTREPLWRYRTVQPTARSVPEQLASHAIVARAAGDQFVGIVGGHGTVIHMRPANMSDLPIAYITEFTIVSLDAGHYT